MQMLHGKFMGAMISSSFACTNDGLADIRWNVDPE